MGKWIMLSATAVIMVGVWTLFFSFLTSGEDTPLPPGNNEEAAIETDNGINNQAAPVSADHEAEVQGSDKENSRNDRNDEEQNEVTQEGEDLEDIPEIIHGDAIGYGEGVAIDSLLDLIMTDD